MRNRHTQVINNPSQLRKLPFYKKDSELFKSIKYDDIRIIHDRDEYGMLEWMSAEMRIRVGYTPDDILPLITESTNLTTSLCQCIANFASHFVRNLENFELIIFILII